MTTTTERYGCFNKKKHRAGYFAPQRQHLPDGRFTTGVKWIWNRMSQGCRYDKSLQDPRCEGCTHRGDGEQHLTTQQEGAACASGKLSA